MALGSGGGAVVLGSEGSMESGRKHGGSCSANHCAGVVAQRCSAVVDRTNSCSKPAGLGSA